MSEIDPRRGERGGTAALALVSLAGLVGVAGLTVLGVKRTTAVAGLQKDHAQALYAAESGVVAATTFLRTRLVDITNWGAYVSPNNATPVSPADIPGNNVQPGQPGNPFAIGTDTWYQVTIFNNRSDPGFAVGTDQDQTLIIRSTGRAADGATVILEVEIGAGPPGPSEVHCLGYAQQGLSELGAGRNDCLTDIDSTVVVTYTPEIP